MVTRGVSARADVDLPVESRSRGRVTQQTSPKARKNTAMKSQRAKFEAFVKENKLERSSLSLKVVKFVLHKTYPDNQGYKRYQDYSEGRIATSAGTTRRFTSDLAKAFPKINIDSLDICTEGGHPSCLHITPAQIETLASVYKETVFQALPDEK